MITATMFVAAAGLGTLVRWRLVIGPLPRPVATMVVNVTGAFALGLIDGWTAPALTVIGLGGLGAYTTFSTLTDDVVELWRDAPRLAFGYVAVTSAAGIGAAAAGLALTR